MLATPPGAFGAGEDEAKEEYLGVLTERSSLVPLLL